jgi:DNA repair protein SbcC/Rad50
MLIRKVTAHSFGPLVGETLEFADGMTVVGGDNESAKSTWHAVIFAALCGRRRGKGRPREDEQRFIDLHRPWDRGDWLVSAEIGLDDGRRIELRQDLAGKVDCHAKDLDIGTDVSGEVMNEGTPDAARWLGLDRSSFVATACVEQAQMLRVRGEASGLQDYLQRAAAVTGGDSTAAAAIERIDVFEREHVGLDRVNSGRPLRRALDAVNRARQSLAAAARVHQEYLQLAGQADALRDAALKANAVVLAHEAARAAWLATDLGDQARRAAALHDGLGGTQPASVAEDDALSLQVAKALTAWRTRPAEPALPGLAAGQIQEQLSALPAMPEGDLRVHDSVQRVIERLNRVDSQFQQHDADRPSDPHLTATHADASDEELLDLAHTLDAPLPVADPALAAQVAQARRDLDALQARGRAANLILAGAAIAAVAGIGLLAAVSPVVGVALLIVAVALAVFGLVRRRAAPLAAAVRRHADLLAQLTEASRQAAADARRRDDAIRRCDQLAVDADPAALRSLVAARARAGSYAGELQRWTDRHCELEDVLTSARAGLAAALVARGQPAASAAPAALASAVRAYQDACEQRDEQAATASKRDVLQAQLTARQAADQRAEHDRRVRAHATDLIAEAGAACGLPPGGPEDIFSALEKWSDTRGEKVQELAAAHADWAELQALLKDRSVAQLQQDACTAVQHARELADTADPALLSVADPATADQRLPDLRETAGEAQAQAADAAGDLRRFAQSVTSVAEAEEALATAQAELARVQDLQQTLTLTRKFLEGAQALVHRDIAPVLAATVKQQLPGLTADRYTDVIVSPTTLEVQVCGPSRQWRTAERLSYGTAEQIYLLLRIALADHLTRNHDTCPLILDDVTVHADATRTRQIVDLLLTIAQDRQVIVFTQEDQVTAWAREHLTTPRNAVHALPALAIS